MAIGGSASFRPGRRANMLPTESTRHRAAQRLALRLEPVAHLAVLVGQRQPLDPALGRAAELRRLHELVPQPLRVDGEIGAQLGHLAGLRLDRLVSA